MTEPKIKAPKGATIDFAIKAIAGFGDIDPNDNLVDLLDGLYEASSNSNFNRLKNALLSAGETFLKGEMHADWRNSFTWLTEINKLTVKQFLEQYSLLKKYLKVLGGITDNSLVIIEAIAQKVSQQEN